MIIRVEIKINGKLIEVLEQQAMMKKDELLATHKFLNFFGRVHKTFSKENLKLWAKFYD